VLNENVSLSLPSTTLTGLNDAGVNALRRGKFFVSEAA